MKVEVTDQTGWTVGAMMSVWMETSIETLANMDTVNGNGCAGGSADTSSDVLAE